MSIDGTWSQEQIVAEYLDTLGYDVDGSVALAQRFIKACRALLVMHPSNWSQTSTTMAFEPRLWEQQLDNALNWLRANQVDQSGSVRHLSFGGDFR